MYQDMTILEKVLTHDLPDLAANRPTVLYHYSALETIQKIVEYDNVRLSHAEYSNDRHELLDAITLIERQHRSGTRSCAGPRDVCLVRRPMPCRRNQSRPVVLML